MPKKKRRANRARLCLVEQERVLQAHVLYELYNHHPCHISMSELRTLVVEDGKGIRPDDVDVAVSLLAEHGLVHRNDGFVFLTVAEVHRRSLPTTW